MGDAAHPMYPIGSNGASQAILDARVITREILAKGATNAALVAYEAERRPATTDLVMLNRRNGPEQVMQTGRGARAQRLRRRHRRAVAERAGRHRRQLQARRRLPGRGAQRQAADRPAQREAPAGCGLAARRDRLRGLDQPRTGRGGREHGTILGHQPPLHEGNGLAELGDIGLAGDRPRLWPGLRKFTVMVMVAV